MAASATLGAVGDLLLCGRYDELMHSDQAGRVFGLMGEAFASSDIIVGNLECPLTKLGVARTDKLCLRGNPAYADVLAQAGFRVLSLANNHMLDYGLDGLRETRRVLDAAGIGAVGAGETLTAASQPLIAERNGLRIGFLAYCDRSTRPSDLATAAHFGVAPLDKDALLADIRRWRSEVDHLVLLLHWGLEYSPLPTPHQVDLAHTAIDAGVSLILGHHSHMLQGIEAYHSGVIAYSLGNCTDSDVDWQGPTRHYASQMTEADRQGLALTVELNSDGARVVGHHALWLNDSGEPEPAVGDRAATILALVEERSKALRDADLARDWANTVVDKRVLGPLRHWWSRGSLWDKIRGFRPSQLHTLFILIITFLRIRFSRSEARWSLFNPRNDTRPMPYAGDDDRQAGS